MLSSGSGVLIPILLQLDIQDVLQTCRIPNSDIRNACLSPVLWHGLLVRDYGTYSPIINYGIKIPHLSLYKIFWSDNLLNSPEFEVFYERMTELSPSAPIFINEVGDKSIFPSLTHTFPVGTDYNNEHWSKIPNLMFLRLEMPETFDTHDFRYLTRYYDFETVDQVLIFPVKFDEYGDIQFFSLFFSS